ncbi:MAG: aminoglycoside phosphotransferase family protein [Gemmatimonadetes bacterium]|nr:aminoglycoside phosphotransferase family protein [Gemmatimonadota bacterium]
MRDADSLAVAVRAWCRRHAATYRLDPSALTVTYVLNWGGFVNHSFHLSDGQRRYHLKLSTDAEDQDALRRWFTHGATLEGYRAPVVIDWVEIDGAAGLLFPYLEGRVPELTDEVVDEVLGALANLWNDRSLAAALPRDQSLTAAQAFRESFHRRFLEDLAGIRVAPPPFVDAALIAWLDAEVASLADQVANHAAFVEPLDQPVHGDLWLNNILWVDRTRWWLLDWDDLRIGDPAMDVAAFLGPTATDPTPLKRLERVHHLLSPGQRARLPLLGQATLLDWVIDPLSDWIDATTSPTHLLEVRAEKERVHRQALETYRQHVR